MYQIVYLCIMNVGKAATWILAVVSINIAGKIQFLKTPVQLTCSTGGQFSTFLAFMRLELRERFALNLEEIHPKLVISLKLYQIF